VDEKKRPEIFFGLVGPIGTELGGVEQALRELLAEVRYETARECRIGGRFFRRLRFARGVEQRRIIRSACRRGASTASRSSEGRLPPDTQCPERRPLTAE
jgi:hypothetical protein